MPAVRLSRAATIAFALAAGCNREQLVRPDLPEVSTPTASATSEADSAGLGIGNGGVVKPSGGDSSGLSVTIYGGPPPPLSSVGAALAKSVGVLTGPAKAPGVPDADAVIKKNAAQFKSCATREVQEDPGLKPSKTTIELTVGSGGEVTKARVIKSNATHDIDACFSGASQALRFKPTGAAATVTFEVTLTRSE